MVDRIHYDALPMNWVGDWAGARARITPAREAVYEVDTDRRWTFAELDDRANRVANWLAARHGVGRGDAVCIIARNRVEFIDLYLACGKAGIVLAPISYRLSPREIGDLLARIRPRLLFVEPLFEDLAAQVDRPEDIAEVIALDGDDPAGQYATEVLAANNASANVALTLEEPFLYVHTGGSTATPKVCIVPHRQMVWNSVELLVAAPEGLAGRRELLMFPFFHIGGWNTFTPVFHAGGRVTIIRQFDPTAALATIEAERINHFGAVEAMLHAMLATPGFAEADLGSLGAITTAGAPCARATMEPFWDRGIAVVQSYGQTEAGPSNFIHGRLDADDAEMRDHHGSIGTAFFHCDHRLVDIDTGRDVSDGETGELWMRSPHNFDGYLGQPERTAATIDREGWVRSGDLARRDANGRVYIVGRADNMIISGGENVSPEEIERVLLDHPAVGQCVAFGVPDARWGEVAMAVIVAEPGAPGDDDLRAWMGERLARFKVPRHIARAEALPLTGAGKLDRNAARRRFFEQSKNGE